MKQELTEDGNPAIDKAICLLSESDAVYYTCHCTGIEQYRYMKNKMGAKLNYLASGQTITI